MKNWETEVTQKVLDEHLSPHQHCNFLLDEALSCALVRTPLHFKTKSCFWCSAYPFPATITNSACHYNHLIFFYFYHSLHIWLNFLVLLDLRNIALSPDHWDSDSWSNFSFASNGEVSLAQWQGRALACYGVKLWQWCGSGVFFLLILGPLLEDITVAMPRCLHTIK